MQTYGLGTAMKILLGYDEQLKRNELVAMVNTLNKVSISVNTYFQYYNKFLPKDSQNSETDKLAYVKVWALFGFTLLIFLLVVPKERGNIIMSRKIDNIIKSE